jgi:hypothetical protein
MPTNPHAASISQKQPARDARYLAIGAVARWR